MLVNLFKNLKWKFHNPEEVNVGQRRGNPSHPSLALTLSLSVASCFWLFDTINKQFLNDCLLLYCACALQYWQYWPSERYLTDWTLKLIKFYIVSVHIQ